MEPFEDMTNRRIALETAVTTTGCRTGCPVTSEFVLAEAQKFYDWLSKTPVNPSMPEESTPY